MVCRPHHGTLPDTSSILLHNGHERISGTVEFFLQRCKVPGISSVDASAIAVSDLIHVLQNPTLTTKFEQPGTERMQAIQKLAAIFEEIAPENASTPRVETTDPHTDPTPRVPAQPTPRLTPPRVPKNTTPNPDTTYHFQYQPGRSPRIHMPPQVTQEECAYQLLSTPLPIIESAYAATDAVTGQQLKYHHLFQWPDLKPIWEKAFENELGLLAQGIRDVKGTDTITFILAEEVQQYRTVTYGRLVCDK
jgi:hypothetical protein